VDDVPRVDITYFKLGDDPAKSAHALAEAIDGSITGILLNDHGSSGNMTLGSSGMLPLAEMKLLEPISLIDVLLARGKLGKGSRVVVSGSESARGIESMGIPAPTLGGAQRFEQLLTGRAYDAALSKDALDMAVYSHVSAISALFFAAFARRRPDVHFEVVSPGLTRDSFDPKIAKQLADTWGGWSKLLALRLLLLPIARIAGAAHEPAVAAKYYVDALTAGEGWGYPSGAFVGHAPPTDTSGPLCNQADHAAFLSDKALQNLAWAAVRKFV